MYTYGHKRITKREFYGAGGFSNPDLFRKADKNGRWKYYRVTDNRSD